MWAKVPELPIRSLAGPASRARPFVRAFDGERTNDTILLLYCIQATAANISWYGVATGEGPQLSALGLLACGQTCTRRD